MSKFLIGLFIKFGRSESLRKGVLFILRDLSAKSDNDIDDAIVKMIEEKSKDAFNSMVNKTMYKIKKNPKNYFLPILESKNH